MSVALRLASGIPCVLVSVYWAPRPLTLKRRGRWVLRGVCLGHPLRASLRLLASPYAEAKGTDEVSWVAGCR